MTATTYRLLERLRSLCVALPEVTEKLSHGSPTWFVKKTFVTWVDDHHGDGNTGFWCAAPAGAQAELTGSGTPRGSSGRRTSAGAAGSGCGW